MKKILVVILIAMSIMTSLVGCNTNDSTNVVGSSNSNIEFWTDEETGVQYIIYDRKSAYGGMGGITPRFNSNGTLYVVD